MLTAVNGTGMGKAAQQAAASSNDGYIYDDGHLRSLGLRIYTILNRYHRL